jgi:hypothetical protein
VIFITREKEALLQLLSVADAFLKRQATIGELRKAVREAQKRITT